jgi:hypothetical protein
MNRHENKANAPSVILPFLYQGKAPNEHSYAAYMCMNIVAIVNCTTHIANHFESMGIQYLRIAAEDAADTDMIPFFEESNRFIGETIN